MQRQEPLFEDNMDPLMVEKIVSKRRGQLGLCPTHGRELEPMPVQLLDAPARMRCPDVGCDFTREVRS